MAKNKGRRGRKSLDPELLKNSGFDEGEIWRLDFKNEIEYEENVVGRFEMTLFKRKMCRVCKKP